MSVNDHLPEEINKQQNTMLKIIKSVTTSLARERRIDQEELEGRVCVRFLMEVRSGTYLHINDAAAGAFIRNLAKFEARNIRIEDKKYRRKDHRQLAYISDLIQERTERIEPHDLPAEVREILLSACRDDLDVAIITGRLAGKSTQMIAGDNGESTGLINQRFQRIKTQLKRQFPDFKLVSAVEQLTEEQLTEEQLTLISTAELRRHLLESTSPPSVATGSTPTLLDMPGLSDIQPTVNDLGHTTTQDSAGWLVGIVVPPGKLVSITAPPSSVLTYTYDALGRLITAEASRTAIDYSEGNQVGVSGTSPNGGAVSQRYDYDAFGELIPSSSGMPCFGESGELLGHKPPPEQVSEQVFKPGESTVTLLSSSVVAIPTFSYDSLSRLAAVDPSVPPAVEHQPYRSDSFESVAGVELQAWQQTDETSADTTTFKFRTFSEGVTTRTSRLSPHPLENARHPEIQRLRAKNQELHHQVNELKELLYQSDKPHKEKIRDAFGQSFGVTKDKTDDKIYGMTDVIELLKKGAAIADIRLYMQATVASSTDVSLPVQLANSLNAWLRIQDPKDPKQQLTLKEKRAVIEFVELLEKASQCQLMRRGEPCRFDVNVDPRHREGSFRARAIGASQGTKRARLSDLVEDSPFEFKELTQEVSESQQETWAETIEEKFKAEPAASNSEGELEPTSQSGNILELLKNNAAPEIIQDRVRELIGSDPTSLETSVNSWLAAQDPPHREDRKRQDQLSLETKQRIAHIVELLCLATGRIPSWKGKECKLEVVPDADNPHGNFRLRALKGGVPLIKRTRLSELLPLNFTAPGHGEWAGKEAGRKSDQTGKTIPS